MAIEKGYFTNFKLAFVNVVNLNFNCWLHVKNPTETRYYCLFNSNRNLILCCEQAIFNN